MTPDGVLCLGGEKGMDITMVRHISIFFFKKEVTDTEKENVRRMLLGLKEKLEGVADYRVGTHCMPLPPSGAAEGPQFGDLVQVIDFYGRDGAESYPRHAAHMELLAETSGYMEKVVAIDFEL